MHQTNQARCTSLGNLGKVFTATTLRLTEVYGALARLDRASEAAQRPPSRIKLACSGRDRPRIKSKRNPTLNWIRFEYRICKAGGRGRIPECRIRISRQKTADDGKTTR